MSLHLQQSSRGPYFWIYRSLKKVVGCLGNGQIFSLWEGFFGPIIPIEVCEKINLSNVLGTNSHSFPMDGHQPCSRGLNTHYQDSLL